MKQRLQAKVAGLALLLLLAGCALALLLVVHHARSNAAIERQGRDAVHRALNDAAQRRGEQTVARLARSLAGVMQPPDAVGIGRYVRDSQHPDTGYIRVFNAAGELLHDATLREVDEVALAGIGALVEPRSTALPGSAVQTRFGPATMDVSAPIVADDRRLGEVHIGYDLGSDRALEDRTVANLRQLLGGRAGFAAPWIAALGILALLLAAWVLWTLQRSWVTPLRGLASTARALDDGRPAASVTAATHRNDEIGDLTRALARMGESAQRHDREIRRLAYTDALTGLANRLAFREALESRLLRLHGAGRQLAVLFVDMDDFKRINDTLGHDAGDEVLLELAARIRQVAGRDGGGEALVARFGGDEFVILIEAAGEQSYDVRRQASRLADALIAELGKPVVVNGRPVFLGTSIGISLFPEDAAGVMSLVKTGDIAMYQAKLAGKNCHRFYSRSMDKAAERRVHLEHELRGAWDRGELSLAYQPVFRFADNVMVGAEALLRWTHPDKGAIAPTVFINIAEESGLIETIGPLVMRKACADAALWQPVCGAAPLFVSVNVSPRQLRSGDLPAMVAGCLRDTGLAPSRLHVELTETAVIGDEAHASRLLSELRATGVQVWLDDFGTGFSGLSHLRRVPVDGVKIDRSFVADILHDPDDLALTTAIIAMGHSLGITVIAEGVEKHGQYQLLRERGCDLAQGYWLGHPVPVDKFRSLGRFMDVPKAMAVPADSGAGC